MHRLSYKISALASLKLGRTTTKLSALSSLKAQTTEARASGTLLLNLESICYSFLIRRSLASHAFIINFSNSIVTLSSADV